MAGEGCDRSDMHLFAMTWKVFSLEILNSSTNLKEINKLKLDLIFLKIVTKNVRKESVLKLIVRGWI